MIDRRPRLGERRADLDGKCGICVLRREHDEGNCIALAVAQLVQQFKAGTRGQRNIEHGDVEAVGGERPARLIDRIDRLKKFWCCRSRATGMCRFADNLTTPTTSCAWRNVVPNGLLALCGVG